MQYKYYLVGMIVNPHIYQRGHSALEQKSGNVLLMQIVIIIQLLVGYSRFWAEKNDPVGLGWHAAPL